LFFLLKIQQKRHFIQNFNTIELPSKLSAIDSFLSAGVFHDTFKSLSVVPDVLYPSLNVSQFDQPADREGKEGSGKDRFGDPFVFLSINRYERKKNLPLALKAFSEFHQS
jgi:alpha-1,3/alpha-1,6-mannosyltransferase